MTASSASNTRARRGARRALVAVALSATAALGLTACGAGQITQTATQIAAVNGGEATVGKIALRNVQLIYPTDTAELLSVDDPVELTLNFVAVNNSPDEFDTLESIVVEGREIQVSAVTEADSTVGDGTESTVEVTTDDLVLNPHGGLTTPLDRFETDVDSADQLYPTRAPLPADEVADVTGLQAVTTVPVVLGPEMRAGNAVDVTFRFAKAGEVTMPVPISAVHDTPRLQPDQNAERNAQYAHVED